LKPGTKRPRGRPWRGRENDIRMDLRELEWEDVDGFIWLRKGTGHGSWVHGNEPSVPIKSGNFLAS